MLARQAAGSDLCLGEEVWRQLGRSCSGHFGTIFGPWKTLCAEHVHRISREIDMSPFFFLEIPRYITLVVPMWGDGCVRVTLSSHLVLI
jgi:hypothetical protein